MQKWFRERYLWFVAVSLIMIILLFHGPGQAAEDLRMTTPTPGADSVILTLTQPGVAERLPAFWHTLAIVGPAMLLSALLGGIVAFRRYVNVFERDLFIAHILLSVAGALMMLIVGNQLVRAFGLLGAASVVRYRYKLINPRDASMLIIALGIGMATGAGLYALAVSATVVVFVFSQSLNLFTKRSNPILIVTRPTGLRIDTTQPEATMARVNRVFGQHGIRFRLQNYRRLKKVLNNEPIYRLVYTLRLEADDNRCAWTSQIADESVVKLRWKTDKPGGKIQER